MESTSSFEDTEHPVSPSGPTADMLQKRVALLETSAQAGGQSETDVGKLVWPPHPFEEQEDDGSKGPSEEGCNQEMQWMKNLVIRIMLQSRSSSCMGQEANTAVQAPSYDPTLEADIRACIGPDLYEDILKSFRQPSIPPQAFAHPSQEFLASQVPPPAPLDLSAYQSLLRNPPSRVNHQGDPAQHHVHSTSNADLVTRTHILDLLSKSSELQQRSSSHLSLGEQLCPQLMQALMGLQLQGQGPQEVRGMDRVGEEHRVDAEEDVEERIVLQKESLGRRVPEGWERKDISSESEGLGDGSEGDEGEGEEQGSVDVQSFDVGRGQYSAATRDVVDEWLDDDDLGYMVYTISEQEFFDMEEDAMAAAQRAMYASRLRDKGANPLGGQAGGMERMEMRGGRTLCQQGQLYGPDLEESEAFLHKRPVTIDEPKSPEIVGPKDDTGMPEGREGRHAGVPPSEITEVARASGLDASWPGAEGPETSAEAAVWPRQVQDFAFSQADEEEEETLLDEVERQRQGRAATPEESLRTEAGQARTVGRTSRDRREREDELRRPAASESQYECRESGDGGSREYDDEYTESTGSYSDSCDHSESSRSGTFTSRSHSRSSTRSSIQTRDTQGSESMSHPPADLGRFGSSLEGVGAIIRRERQKGRRRKEKRRREKQKRKEEERDAGKRDDEAQARTAGQLTTFNLPIVYESGRTGFEATKDFQPPLDSIIAGRYRVVDQLGSAVFSTAFECIDLAQGPAVEEGTFRYVCLKIIRNNKDYFDQSLDEIKLLQYLKESGNPDKHHFLHMFDYFYYKEHLILSCELLKDNLYECSKYLRRTGQPSYFTLDRLRSIARQCLEGLAFISSLDLIHCDIKIIDFGSSCFLTDKLTSYVQSRSYRAPEVILGAKYGTTIDVWSMGCVIAELFAGYVLFQNDSIQSMLARIQSILGPFPSDLLLFGKDVPKYFTSSYTIYQRDFSDTESQASSPPADHTVSLLYPKQTNLAARLHTDDLLFVDFVQYLLQVHPAQRPTAQAALEHPWLR